MTVDMVEMLIESMPNVRKFGNVFTQSGANHHSEGWKSNDMKRLQNRIKEENWDLSVIECPKTEEKEFAKLLTLHWFYLTEGPTSKKTI